MTQHVFFAQQAAKEKEALLLHWLQDLDRANTQAQPPAPLQPKERHEQYLYVLSVGEDKPASPVLRLQAMTSHLNRGGIWAKPKRIAVQPALGHPAFDRASDAERTLLQLLGALPGWHATSSYYYSSAASLLCVLPQGSVGQQVLQQAVSTGRLLTSVNDQLSDAPVQWGESLALDWVWKEAVEGQWSLRPKLSKASAKLCLNNPPLYLDAARGLCGPVDAGALTLSQLQVLLRPPALSREAVKKYQIELVQRLGPVPLPPLLDDLPRIVGKAPVAHLQASGGGLMDDGDAETSTSDRKAGQLGAAGATARPRHAVHAAAHQGAGGARTAAQD